MNAADRILQAAATLFQEHGTRGATTRRIAEAAGVNEVTLFRRFGTKQRLLQEALLWSARHTPVARLPREPRDPRAELTGWSEKHMARLRDARAMIRTTMGEFEERPEMACTMSEIPARVAAELRGYLERLTERGMAHPDLDVEAATALLMGALFVDAMSRDIDPDRFGFTMDEAAGRYVGLFVRAIGAEGTSG